MPRKVCPKCHYPEVTCLCNALENIPLYQTKVKLHVLQHPSEVTNKKNTIKLVSLLIPQIQVYIGETERDFKKLRQGIESGSETFILLYPSEKALSGQEFLASAGEPAESFALNLILIDGTWRKAKKILLSNPWLQDLTHLTLASDHQSQYGIRQTSVEGALSSIEAIAYCLEQLEGTEPEPLLALLGAFKQSFTKLMPSNVKKRYS